MEKLYIATKNWINIPDMVINYTDENNANNSTQGYTGITTSNGLITFIGKNGATNTTIETKTSPLKARLPMESEILGTGCLYEFGSCPAWKSYIFR